jgi:hypothetical protein
MTKELDIKITQVGSDWVGYITKDSAGSIHLKHFKSIPNVGDKYSLTLLGSEVKQVRKLKSPLMYARCLDSRHCRLVENFEYEVVSVHVCAGYGESLFYLLDDGLLYASCHFSSTYYK